MPPLTQTLGPWIQPVDGSSYRQISKIHDYTSALLRQIPECDYFNQNAHYDLEDTLPFHWQGFENNVRYTYVLEDLSDVDALWSNMAGRPRRAIRKAEKVVSVQETDNVNLFVELYIKTFARQDLDTPVNAETIRAVYTAARARNAVKILCARDAKGVAHAAVFLLYDHRTTYYLMGGSDPQLRESQALSLLLWEGIKFASTVSERFDFEGSMIESVESFFRSFGASRKTYYAISKMSTRFRLAWDARAAFRRFRDRD